MTIFFASVKYTPNIDRGFKTLFYLVIMIIVLCQTLIRINKIHHIEVDLLHSFLRAIVTVVPAPLFAGFLFDFVLSDIKPMNILDQNSIELCLLNTGAAIIVAMFYSKKIKTSNQEKNRQDDTLDSYLD